MHITNKIFWNEALKGGIVIGLAWVVFSALKLVTGDAVTWIVSILEFLGISALLYIFARKMSNMADPAEGFPYGRCIGFTVSMLLFAGVIMGMWATINANFISRDAIMETMDEMLYSMQDLLGGAEFDTYQSMMRGMMTNPLVLIPTSIISCVIMGVIPGLVTSAIAKKDPDIFGRPEDDDDDD